MKHGLYVVIETGGSLEQVEMSFYEAGPGPIGLEDLQRGVGGLIELVVTTDEVSVFCNEEGKLQGLPVNDVATSLWHHYLNIDWGEPEQAKWFDRLVGPVVIAGGTDKDGNQLGLTEQGLREFADILLLDSDDFVRAIMTIQEGEEYEY